MSICREMHVKQQQTPAYSQLDMHLPARREVFIYACVKIIHDKY